MADTQVLDLLFDDDDGVLKEEVPYIQTLDFSSLGLTAEDLLFSDFMHIQPGQDESSNTTDQVISKSNTLTAYQQDHDYFAPQKSPAGSDSGVSLESSTDYSNGLFDQLVTSPSESILSGSPHSQPDLSPTMVDFLSDKSPFQSDQSDMSPLGMEDLDMRDIGMDLDTVDPTALLDTQELLRLHKQDGDDVTIDFNGLSPDMTFDGTTSIAVTTTGVQTKTIRLIPMSKSGNSDTLPFTVKDVQTSDSQFPDLHLLEEEKELLSREGIVLPTNMPLTKEEERALKGVRRKIRNKVSAKESRKRKQGYVEGLEKRVKLCTSENVQLSKKVDSLQKQNSTIMTQLRKLQALLSGSRASRPAQTTTCVMVLLLSFAFLVVPSFNPFRLHSSMPEMRNMPIPGNSRSLLHTAGDSEVDADDPYGLSVRPGPPWEDFKLQTPAEPVPFRAKPKIVDDYVPENSYSEEQTELFESGVKAHIGIMEDNEGLGDAPEHLSRLVTSDLKTMENNSVNFVEPGVDTAENLNPGRSYPKPDIPTVETRQDL